MIDKAYKSLFRDHLADVDESYWQHMGQAISYALLFLLTGLAMLVHACIPGLFSSTGTNMVNSAHAKLLQRRQKRGVNG